MRREGLEEKVEDTGGRGSSYTYVCCYQKNINTLLHQNVTRPRNMAIYHRDFTVTNIITRSRIYIWSSHTKVGLKHNTLQAMML